MTKIIFSIFMMRPLSDNYQFVDAFFVVFRGLVSRFCRMVTPLFRIDRRYLRQRGLRGIVARKRFIPTIRRSNNRSYHISVPKWLMDEGWFAEGDAFPDVHMEEWVAVDPGGKKKPGPAHQTHQKKKRGRKTLHPSAGV